MKSSGSVSGSYGSVDERRERHQSTDAVCAPVLELLLQRWRPPSPHSSLPLRFPSSGGIAIPNSRRWVFEPLQGMCGTRWRIWPRRPGLTTVRTGTRCPCTEWRSWTGSRGLRTTLTSLRSGGRISFTFSFVWGGGGLMLGFCSFGVQREIVESCTCIHIYVCVLPVVWVGDRFIQIIEESRDSKWGVERIRGDSCGNFDGRLEIQTLFILLNQQVEDDHKRQERYRERRGLCVHMILRVWRILLPYVSPWQER